MKDYLYNLLYVCLAPFDCGWNRPMALMAAGFILLGLAAQVFLLSKKKRIACLPILCAAAALSPSVLLYLALSGGLSVSFLNSFCSDLIIYAAIAAVYSFTGIWTGWLVYFAWNRFHTLGNTDP